MFRWGGDLGRGMRGTNAESQAKKTMAMLKLMWQRIRKKCGTLMRGNMRDTNAHTKEDANGLEHGLGDKRGNETKRTMRARSKAGRTARAAPNITK